MTDENKAVQAPPQERVNALTSRKEMTPAQVKLLRETVCRDATEDEFKIFIAVAGRTGLDPFTRQIHFVKRWDPVLERMAGTFQTGIDGYRLIAQRTGDYDGQDAKEWCGPDGVWAEVWLKEEPPIAARAKVYRRGIARPFVAVARYKSYCQRKKDGSPNSMWVRMDAEQLAKCAEALVLRMAFPNELSDLYTHEEMAQAESFAEVAKDEERPGAGASGVKAALGLAPAGITKEPIEKSLGSVLGPVVAAAEVATRVAEEKPDRAAAVDRALEQLPLKK